MGNEVVIEVGAVDKTGPVKDQLKASWTQFEKSFPPLDVKATNPVNEAFIAQVRAGIKSISKDALQIPIEADMVPFEAQLEAVLTDLAGTTKLDVPIDVADAMAFREQVQGLVAQVEASVKAVIDVEVNDQSLGDVRAKTIAASQATLDMAGAQQKLNAAMAAGDEVDIKKARDDVVTATRAEQQATEDLAAAQAAAAEEAAALAEEEKGAAVAAGGLKDMMGPLWMVMNVAQIAMFAFGSSSSDTASKVEDVSQQIVGLGTAAGDTAQNLLMGNENLQKISGQLTGAGTSASAFAQAYSGSVQQAQQYTDGLTRNLASLGAQTIEVTQQFATYDAQGNQNGSTTQTYTESVKQLAAQVNSNKDAYNALTPAQKQVVDQYNALNGIIPQASNALAGTKNAAAATQQTLASLGFTMTAGEQAANSYGGSVQAAAKALQDATAGARYMEDAQDKATITAGQGIQSYQQLQATVASAGQSYRQSAEAVVAASHGEEQASQAVAAAKHAEGQASDAVAQSIHAEQQAVLAVTSAQEGYTDAVYQEEQAQDAVTAARAAAEQQLISLRLQSDGAAASAQSARLSLFQAQQEASKYGINSGNAEAIANGPITAGNAAQVAAADALIAAQNQVAQSQNSASSAQSALNTARQQGVDNSPSVLSAEHALVDAEAGVRSAADGVANAKYAEQQSVNAVASAHYAQEQAAIAVTNAEWGLQSASEGVGQAEDAEHQASDTLKTARDNATRSVDANTLAGAQNRQVLEQIFTAYENESGSEQIAAQMTQNVGKQMGFTSGQIQDVIGKVNGLNGMDAKFSLTGTPTLNSQQLTQIGQQLGMSFSQIEQVLPGPGQAGYRAPGRAKAVGGPGGGLTWVGEQGPELVQLAPGSNVIPSANSMQRALLGEVPAPRRANGGPVSSSAVLGANLPVAAQWGAMDVVGNMLYALGGPKPTLPAAGAVDMGAFSAGSGLGFGSGGSHVSGDRAANKAIMQAVFASYGWGSGPAWAAQDYVEMREAGYDNFAQNKTSTAFGMGQFLNSTWGGYGFQKTSDPRIQSIAMAEYEKARYGGPIGAAQHERSMNWYRGGGPTGASGLIGVGEDGPELVRVPGGSSVVPHANAGTALRDAAMGGPFNITLEVAGSDSAAATFLRSLIKTGALQLTANGQPVRVP